MSGFAVRCQSLSKAYRVGGPRYRTLRESLVRAGSRVVRRGAGSSRRAGADVPGPGLIWALDDVSIEVSSGESVGIIGPNGAGKSTLLKILAKVTRPSRGHVEVRGRVGALLEIGAGFHPELTGRENIFLGGAILGMKKSEIERRFGEIVEFAETGAFIDTPVKRYSTGMYQRLAFSVAAHLDSDILLVDEGLAIGDARFQERCTGKIRGVRTEGRTVLFVSHNMLAIESLCERVVLLRRGRIEAVGRPRDVIERYLADSHAAQREQVWTDLATAPGSDTVRLRRVGLYPDGSTTADVITVRTGVAFEVEYWNFCPSAVLAVTIHLYNDAGILVFESGSSGGQPLPPGLFRATCSIPGDLLNDGRYLLNVLIVRDQSEVVCHLDNALVFTVADVADLRGAFYGEWRGVVRPRLEWRNEFVEPLPRAGLSAGMRPVGL